MPTRLEESLERDIERIRQQVLEMSALAERALRDCVEALAEGNRQRAYAVILRDQYIDEKEKEIDRLCLEFLRPAAARRDAPPPRLQHDQDQPRARARGRLRGERRPPAPAAEQPSPARPHPRADRARWPTSRSRCSTTRSTPSSARTPRWPRGSSWSSRPWTPSSASSTPTSSRRSSEKVVQPEMLEPLVNIGRRFERVADQARNVCMETLYMCTGEYAKHPGAETFRILFVGRAQRLPQPDGGGDRPVARPAEVHLLERRARPAARSTPGPSPS